METARISPAGITGIYRYPVKGLTPEALQRAELRTGQTLTSDRRYAIENGPSGFDPAAPAFLPKAYFLMLMRNERLAGLHTRFEDSTHLLTIARDDEVVARGELNTAAVRASIEQFFTANFASELKGVPKILSCEGHSFSDVARKVVSIINLASVGAIKSLVDCAVHPLRFRANMYVTGWPAWHEFDLLDRTLAIGDVRLKVVKRIQRCAAVNVDPDTAARDLDIPRTLERRLGHADCGIYAEVVAPGTVAVGDEVAVEEPRLL